MSFYKRIKQTHHTHYLTWGFVSMFLGLFIFTLSTIYLFSFDFPTQQKKINKLPIAQAESYNASTGNGDNVSGFAWSSNIGWISFNSANCDSNDDRTTDTGNYPQCQSGQPSKDYGVQIAFPSGEFSGYAWSSNIGWISFNNADASHPVATLNIATGDISGYAKILSLGDDGWIKFNHGQSNEVRIPDLSDGDFVGYAWNGNDNGTGIGWISFKGSNYAVNVQLPTPELTLSVGNPAFDVVCNTNNPLATDLSWTFTSSVGAHGVKYRIIIKDNDDSNITIFDSEECIGSGNPSNKCFVDVPCMDGSNTCTYSMNNPGNSVSKVLEYGRHYRWSVQVWDNYGLTSGEVYYNGSESINDDGNNATFQTYKHAFPNPDKFDWFPQTPSVGEQVKFMSTTSAKYYSATPGTTVSVEHNCSEIRCSWEWECINGTNCNPSNPADASTTILSFTDDGTHDVKLTVEDSDGYRCSSSTSLSTKMKLPTWIESR